MSDLVRPYLNSIGKTPLLSATEEIECGKQILAMQSLINKRKVLAERLRREPTNAEWIEFCQLSVDEFDEVMEAGKFAQEKMVKSNLRLVVSVAKKYNHIVKRFENRGVGFLDIIQEGSLGLNQAALKFDYRKGFKFSTYAYWWIRQAIQRAIADQCRTIRIPPHINEQLRQIRNGCKHLSRLNQRQPTLQELSIYLEMPQAKLQYLLTIQQGTLSLDFAMGDDLDTSLIEVLPDSNTDFEAMENADQVEQLLTTLPDKERSVIQMAFGMDDGRPKTLKSIGHNLGLSAERVRQIKRKAIRKLRKAVVG